MYKLSIPADVQIMDDRTAPIYLEEFKKAGVDRIFLCGIGRFYDDPALRARRIGLLKKYIPYFQDNGFEVGVWLDGLGHGGALSHETQTFVGNFTHMEGFGGGTAPDSFCPMDEAFAAGYCDFVAEVAATHPSIIMFDDDYRLSVRGYGIGCSCPLHRAAYKKMIGEEIPQGELEQRIFSGGKNRYRDAWLELMRETLVGFAKRIRESIDAVDDGIRMGVSMCYDLWDLDGTDGIELAYAFAGKTEPFLRTIGAPYWTALSDNKSRGTLQSVIEYNRMEAAWCRGSGIEVFTEGDCYPRPRYNIPSRLVELFDMALLCTNETDGVLKYMFDYTMDVNYEKGYNARHIHNQPIREGMKEIFAGKKAVGVQVFEQMRRIADWDFGPNAPGAGFLCNSMFGRAQRLLTSNAVPTAYDEGDGPVIVFGESANYLPESALSRGVICDVSAAENLRARGIDTGLLAAERRDFSHEAFAGDFMNLYQIGGPAFYAMTCADGAKAESYLEPGHCPAAYTYENAAGQRFYVLAYDGNMTPLNGCENFLYSYSRQQQLVDAAVWVGRKPLPAYCLKNPLLYLIASRSEDGKSMAVGLFDIFEDEMIDAPVVLDRVYDRVRFVNCTGHMEGATVVIDYVEPYGFAGFEVSMAE